MLHFPPPSLSCLQLALEGTLLSHVALLHRNSIRMYPAVFSGVGVWRTLSVNVTRHRPPARSPAAGLYVSSLWTISFRFLIDHHTRLQPNRLSPPSPVVTPVRGMCVECSCARCEWVAGGWVERGGVG